MALASTGPLALPVQRARKLLAASASWQALVGHAGDATSAEAFIYDTDRTWEWGDADKGTPTTDVWAAVALGDGLGALPGTAVFSGSVIWHIEVPVPTEYRNNDSLAFTYFDNQLGAILGEMIAAATADVSNLYLAARWGELHVERYRVPEADRESDGDRIWADVTVPWGPKG